MMPTIGLTGNFGMGKSTVLKLFNKLGASTFSADDFVHNILKDPAIIRKLVSILGRDVERHTAKGISLNKKRVADIIFNNAVKRKAVEETIHPEVLKTIKLTASEISARKPSSIVIFEVPLLFEADYSAYFKKTIVVYCNRDTVLQRLSQKGFSKNDSIKRIKAQMPITVKKKLADFSINNSNGIEKTKSQVHRIYEMVSRRSS
jgi:dephospho-CoA kinase